MSIGLDQNIKQLAGMASDDTTHLTESSATATSVTAAADAQLIAALQSELHSLRNRLQELESENAKLSAQLSKCGCQKMEQNTNGSRVNDENLVDKNAVDYRKLNEIKPGSSTKMMWQFPRQYVVLKVMYFGQRFYGFASEAQMEPTIESELFKALEKTRLIKGDKKELQYSRCGRTDKGVSSVGQVIALYLRSNHIHKDRAEDNGHSGETSPQESCGGEIDYVKILNRVLPSDIRIMGWSPAPINFSARFSCLSRVYKYFFWRENLNIMAMETAGSKLIGEHDFRNFCKMDAANVHNYRRHITLFKISPCNERFEDDELWVIEIKGSAFLWHQIRCVVAVLFMIGQGLESPNVIDELLDIERMPRKPQYKMAPEIPLVLQSCEFEGLKFICSSDAQQALRAHLENECRSYKLQGSIFHEALMSFSSIEDDGGLQNNRTRKKEPSHVPLMSRPTEPSYEERRIKFNPGIAIQR